jgi:hypothetical protein
MIKKINWSLEIILNSYWLLKDKDIIRRQFRIMDQEEYNLGKKIKEIRMANLINLKVNHLKDLF